MEKSLQVVELSDYALTPEKIQNQVNIIQKVMAQVMKQGEHYGTIPGCGNKPTLLKPGAEKLSVTFHLAPKYDIKTINLGNGHREEKITCTLTLIGTDTFIGQGVGSCSTMEGKYRFRTKTRTCPECSKENTIIKGKKEYGGGWLCYKNKGGCGAKFKDNDPFIINQDIERVEHDNPADYYNTVLKMAKKRAHVDAILTATGASDIFTQDIEDMPEVITGAKDGVQDAEFTEIKKETKKAAKPKLIEATISEVQAIEINDLILESGTDPAKFMDHYNISKINDLPLVSYDSAIKKLKLTLSQVKATE
jgi:hypothetical protein